MAESGRHMPFVEAVAACIIAILCFSNCDGGHIFEYHPYEGRVVGKTGIIAGNVERIERLGAGCTTFRFALISDTQGWYDETRRAVDSLNARADIDFVVNAGDLTNYGVTDEFEWMRDEMERLSVPYVTVLGNHDCIGYGEHIYSEIFGPWNYGFTVGNTRFEIVNTVALEYDYSVPVPDFSFMASEAHIVDSINHMIPDSITHTVVVMHSRPGSDQFNNNVSDAFQKYYLKMFPGFNDDTSHSGVMTRAFCLNGHDHRHSVTDLMGDGIMYYGVPNIEKGEYFVFTIDKDGYSYECVSF